MIAVFLQCTLCDTKLSASNESRIADSHLKNAGCPKVKSDPDIAVAVAATFMAVKEADAAVEKPDQDEQQALKQLQSKKRKAAQPWLMYTSVVTSRLS